MYENPAPSSLQKRSLSLYGHRTSIALEGEFWQILERMAQRQGRPLAAFIADLDTTRPPEQALASLLRLTALRFALQEPPEPEHKPEAQTTTNQHALNQRTAQNATHHTPQGASAIAQRPEGCETMRRTTKPRTTSQ